MFEYGTRFLVNTWSDLTAVVAGIAVVMASFYLLSLPRAKRYSRRAAPAWVVVAVFLVALGYSIWVETLAPLVRAGETGRAVYTGFGIVLILAGVVGILFGGFRIVFRILRTLNEESVRRNIEVVRGEPRRGRGRRERRESPEAVRAARRHNLNALLRALHPGWIWMVGGFGLLALGGWLSQAS